MYTDEDYAGLMKIADAGMEKEALDPIYINTGNKWGDIGANLALYMTPGVGGVISAYDAARNYGDAWSDFRNGRWGKGFGNLGSGLLNTAFAGMNFVGLGGVGGAIKGLTKGVSAGAKAMNAAKAAKRIADFGTKAHKAFNTAGNVFTRGWNKLGPAGRFISGTGNYGWKGTAGSMATTYAIQSGIDSGMNRAVESERKRNDRLIEDGRKKYEDVMRTLNMGGGSGNGGYPAGYTPGYGTRSSSVYGNPYGVGAGQPYDTYGGFD